MKSYQYIFISTLAVSLVGITGCNLSSTTNTSTNNTNTASVNSTNTAATNSNSNTNVVATTNTDTTEIDTSDWETYTNEEYGFSFKYPKEWVVSTNQNNVGCVSDASIVCDTYSYGEGSFDDFPVEYVYGKIVIEHSGSFSTMTEKEILMTKPGKETMPLIDESFLTINTIPAYRSFRQLNKGELLRPTVPDSTERTESTSTEIEYRYVNQNDLIRASFTINSENTEPFYQIVDLIGQSFSI